MVAGRRLLLNVLSVGSDMGQRFCHEENGRSWRASRYVRLYVEAVFMPDRNRGPVTPPAAAVKSIYQSHGGSSRDETVKPPRKVFSNEHNKSRGRTLRFS